MGILAIDTSGHETGVGLLLKGGERFIHVRADRSTQKQSLYDVLAELCEQYSVSSRDVSRCILGAGPGSFTGLRVSYAFTKGFCMPEKRPLKTLSSHHAAALGIQTSTIRVILGYAGRKECFCSAYSEVGDVLFEHEVCEVSALKSELESRLNNAEYSAFFYGKSILDTTVEYKEIGAAEVLHGLLHYAESESSLSWSYDIQSFSDAAPQYVRPVNAKTIAERLALKSEKTKT